MKKDQQIFIVFTTEVKEGIFVSENTGYIYSLDKLTGIVSGYQKQFVFENKEEALQKLIDQLKEKLASRVAYDNRIKEASELLDKLEKISEEFDLKKKEVTKR